MSTVKKAFEGLYSVLSNNLESSVNDLMPQLMKFMAPKTGGGGGRAENSTSIMDNGVPLAIFCYYHKRWELVSEVEFGSKASSSTKLNSMCKEGSSKWTSQYNVSKKESAELLTKVSDGELLPQDIPQALADIEEARLAITPREDGLGYESKEDAEAELGYESQDA